MEFSAPFRLRFDLEAFFWWSKYLTEMIGENRRILSPELCCLPRPRESDSPPKASTRVSSVPSRESFRSWSEEEVVVISRRVGRSGEGYSEYDTDDEIEEKGKKGTHLERIYLKKY